MKVLMRKIELKLSISYLVYKNLRLPYFWHRWY